MEKIIDKIDIILDEDEQFQDESIVHELIHLHYIHLGKMFKEMMSIYLKDEIQ